MVRCRKHASKYARELDRLYLPIDKVSLPFSDLTYLEDTNCLFRCCQLVSPDSHTLCISFKLNFKKVENLGEKAGTLFRYRSY